MLTLAQFRNILAQSFNREYWFEDNVQVRDEMIVSHPDVYVSMDVKISEMTFSGRDIISCLRELNVIEEDEKFVMELKGEYNE